MKLLGFLPQNMEYTFLEQNLRKCLLTTYHLQDRILHLSQSRVPIQQRIRHQNNFSYTKRSLRVPEKPLLQKNQMPQRMLIPPKKAEKSTVKIHPAL
jgi:hypothetical protein